MSESERDAHEISIVIPVKDEEGALPSLDAELVRVLSALGRASEIIYVDDGSRDGSRDVLHGLAEARGRHGIRTRVLTLRRCFGQTAALAAGFDVASGGVIIPMDGDGQNDPADIPRLLAKLDDGYDVVSGWRRRRHDAPMMRRLPSYIANRLLGIVSGLPLHDYGCTLKAYRSAHLKGIRLYGDMHRFIPAYVASGGARVAEMEVNHRPRTTGVSKYGPRRIASVGLDLFLLRFMTRYYSKPIQFFGHVAIAFFVATLAVLATMVVFKFGWLSYIGVPYEASFIQTPLPALAASFLVAAHLSLFFGILGEVLIRIHHESQGRMPYVILDVKDSAGSATDKGPG